MPPGRPGEGRGPIEGCKVQRNGYVYILTNKTYGTLYVGVTSNLPKRIWEHKEKVVPGFSAEHALDRLVWYECHESVFEAIRREKTIKRWHRDWKVNLIQAVNPDWKDLYRDLAP
jgi:putative endonuclease